MPKEFSNIFASSTSPVKIVATSAYLTSATDNITDMQTDNIAVTLSAISENQNAVLQTVKSDNTSKITGYMTHYRAYIHGDNSKTDEWYRTHTKLCADFALSGLDDYWLTD